LGARRDFDENRRMSTPKTAPGMATRALLALVLMGGFYALAVAIAGALFAIPYFEWVELRHVTPKLALACIVGGLTILWAVLPRPDRFEAPGPRLLPSEHPQLFALIERVALATSQAMPVEVYLVHDMNAFVAQRGGVMGLGSRRIMGLGLPLLQAMDVTQLEAVLAHEFGHYHGGDVKLGPWIYKTRAAIIRTVVTLAERGARILHKPFVWYGKLFLRITHAISRRQEHAADALAASVVGAKPLVDGLKLVHGGAIGFAIYWREDVLPALEAGFRPPLLAGFSRFLGVPRAKELMDGAIDEALAGGESDPYDTHPPLRERIAALAGFAELAPGTQADPRPALTLLRAGEDLERSLLMAMARDPARVSALVPVAWDEVGERVYAKSWQGIFDRARPHLGGLLLANIPAQAEFFAGFARKLAGSEADGAPVEALASFGASQLAGALAHHLARAGWAVTALPGEPVALAKDGARIEPFTRLVGLAAGRVTLDEWRADCAAAGIATLDLGTGEGSA
jgi:Zn-dependent protease with chaperone function